MDRDDLALDGLLRELGRAPDGDDAFVQRVLTRTRPRRPSLRAVGFAAAAGLFIALGVFLDAPPTARMGFRAQACLVPEAKSMRLLSHGRLLGEAPIDGQVLVPTETPIVLQAVGADGMAVWTAPTPVTLHRGEVRGSPTGPVTSLSKKDVDYRRDVKPILDQHCAGCHAEGELLAAATPYQARRSALVTQTHGLIPAPELRQLALWVDLGAARP